MPVISKSMPTILLLSPGRRLAPILVETARNLSKQFHVVAVLMSGAGISVPGERPVWDGLDNVTIYELLAEVEARAGIEPLQHVAAIERETGLSLYRSASNHLLYQRFTADYFHVRQPLYFGEDEIVREYVGAYSLFNEIFERYRPVVAFCETPDTISYRLAQAMGRTRGIFVLGNAFNNIFGDGIAYFTHGCNRRSPLLEYFYTHPAEIEADNFAKADALVERLAGAGLHNAHYVEFHKARISQRAALPARVMKGWRALRSAETYRRLPSRLLHERNRRWLNDNMKHSLPQGRYILVSLHYQPEASTTMVAPRWCDQDIVIEQLATTAPQGIRIAVKENPKGFGSRGEHYFWKLSILPNVDLIHPTVSNSALLQGAELIFPIAGTAGMEGIALGKKVAVLGRPSYDIFRGLRRLDCPEDVFRHMADPEWRPGEMAEERRTFLAAMSQACHFLGVPQSNTPWPLPQDAGANYALALQRFCEFLGRRAVLPEHVDASL